MFLSPLTSIPFVSIYHPPYGVSMIFLFSVSNPDFQLRRDLRVALPGLHRLRQDQVERKQSQLLHRSFDQSKIRFKV